ncbi:hypothetical protein [Tunturiibacter gelidoferens]|uniref:hypothetical protein n=1 Tax=Tunturiibacter gelidiferens TaxID=3069689 RepID=UPI003872AEAC
MQRESKLSDSTKHRRKKYLNNIYQNGSRCPQASYSANLRVPDEEDSLRHYQRVQSDAMIRRGHCLACKPRIQEDIPLVNKLFEVFSVAA